MLLEEIQAFIEVLCFQFFSQVPAKETENDCFTSRGKFKDIIF